MSKGSLHIKKTEKFEKDLKKLLKKFRSIEDMGRIREYFKNLS